MTINRFLKRAINLITFVGLSFFIDIVLSFFIKKISFGKILVLHGTLYLIYGSVLLITYMAFDSARHYEKLHNKKHILPLPREIKVTDIFYSIAGGFALIILEIFFH